MSYKFAKAFIIFSFLSMLSFSVLEAKPKSDKKSNSATLEQILPEIDAQLMNNVYSEKLYNFKVKEGSFRVLIVNNPEKQKILLGNMTIGMRAIVGYEANMPDYCFDQINERFEKLEIKNIFYSGGSINGKTIFELFGY